MEGEDKVVFDQNYWEWADLSAHLDRLSAQLDNRVRGRQLYAVDWVEGETVLDVGCEVGICSYYLARNGKKVVGIDVEKARLEIAERKFSHPNLKFLPADGVDLNFPDESFDCVLLLEVLEHTFHPRGLIREIHRVLKPGGHLIISVPNASSYHTVVRSLLLPIKSYFAKMESWPDFATDQRDHYYYWDAFTLYRLLNRQGFKYTDHCYVDNSRLVNLLGGIIPPLKKISTCFMIKVQKQSGSASEVHPAG
ncbi:class I SAM-dependent methyltransferase [Gemmatimonadota bacterium]